METLVAYWRAMFGGQGLLPVRAATSAAMVMAVLWIHRCPCSNEKREKFHRIIEDAETRFFEDASHGWGADAGVDRCRLERSLEVGQQAHVELCEQMQHLKTEHKETERLIAPLRNEVQVFAFFHDAWLNLVFADAPLACSQDELQAQADSWMSLSQ
jgi:hypothetical protein